MKQILSVFSMLFLLFFSVQSQTAVFDNVVIRSGIWIDGTWHSDLSSGGSSSVTPMPQLPDGYVYVLHIRGQSNSQGAGENISLEPSQLLPQDDIFIYNDTAAVPGWEPLEIGHNNFGALITEHGIEAGLIKYKDQFFGDQPLYIIKRGWGGTPITDHISGRSLATGFYDLQEEAYQALLDDDKIPYAAMYWHQGESGPTDSLYSYRLDTLIYEQRLATGRRTPILLGQPGNPVTVLAPSAFESRAKYFDNVATIYTKDLPREDGSHYTYVGQDSIALRMLRAWAALPSKGHAYEYQTVPLTLDPLVQEPPYDLFSGSGTGAGVVSTQYYDDEYAIDLSTSPVSFIDMSTSTTGGTLSLSNPLNGKTYTIIIDNNTGGHFITFPDNFYGVQDSVLAPLAANDARSSVLHFVATDTAFVLISPQYGTQSTIGTGIEPEYQAVLDYATNNGIALPSASQQTLQNQMVVDLKVAGAWNNLDVFYLMKHDGAKEFSYINWIDTSQYNITANGTGGSFVPNVGITTGSGANWMNTNYQPVAGVDNYNAPAGNSGLWVGINPSGSGNFDIGNATAPNVIFKADFGGTSYWNRHNTNGGDSQIAHGGDINGIYYIDQSAGTSNTILYKDDVSKGAITAGTGQPGGAIYIGNHGGQVSTSTFTFFMAGANVNSVRTTVYNIIDGYLQDPTQ